MTKRHDSPLQNVRGIRAFVHKVQLREHAYRPNSFGVHLKIDGLISHFLLLLLYFHFLCYALQLQV